MRLFASFFLLALKLLLISQLFWVDLVCAKTKQSVSIALLIQERVPLPGTSNLDPVIKEKGLLGAALGISDNNTTGTFTGQEFVLKKIVVPVAGSAEDVFNKHIAGKYNFVISLLDAGQILKIADLPVAQKMLFFDAATIDDALRNQQCRNSILHILPSRAMRADALAQYMVKKRWTKWFLVIGKQPEDRLYVEALKRSAKQLNIDIVQEKVWGHTFESGRTAQADVAAFSQVDDYDVLVVADERGEFGEYLDYRTWLPRPVIGTQGLVATAWHRTHEQWGAVQIQNRFNDKAGRPMEEQDYAAYLAVRAIGEAVTRTKTMEISPVKDYLLSEKFALQGYKGSPLSFRPWDNQLRQPVLLAAPRSLVAVAPIEGFLHQKTELDTLGYDQPQSHCQWQKQP